MNAGTDEVAPGMCCRKPASGGRKGCSWLREHQVHRQRGPEDMHIQGLTRNVVLWSIRTWKTEAGKLGGRQGLGLKAL